MREDRYDAFISYRRNPDTEMARLLLTALENAGYKVFRDLEGLGPGRFSEALLERIARTPNFVVILSRHSLDRREGADDYFCREIGQAVRQGRNIIPVLMPGFEFPLASELAEEVKPLPSYNGIRYLPDYHDAAVEKIIDNLRVGLFRRLSIRLGAGRRRVRAKGDKRRARALGLAVLTLLLAGAGFAAYKFLRKSGFVRPEGPTRFLNGELSGVRESAPAFSPDGKEVVYVSSQGSGAFDLYRKRVNDNAEPVRLTNSEEVEHCPVWSSEHDIAYLREAKDPREKWGLYKIPDTGVPLTGEVKLADAFPKRSIGGRIEGRSISWSPDGKSLALMDKLTDEEPFRIYLLPAVPGGGRVALTNPNPKDFPGDSNPAFSPDGRMLAFTRAASTGSSNIFVLRLRDDGRPDGEPFAVTSHNKWVVDLAWTPDSRSLVFSSNQAGGKYTIWALPAEPFKKGVKPKEVVGGTGENLFGAAVSGNWELAFSKFAEWNIDLVAHDTRPREGGRPLPEVPAYSSWEVSPHFSRDGGKISYASDQTGPREVYVFDLKTSRLAQVTNRSLADIGSPRLSPDGRRVVFDSEQNANRDVYVAEAAEGASPQPLVADPSLDVRPSWSADGEWVYFGSNRTDDPNRTGTFQVWKVPSGGKGPAVQVTRGGGREAFASLDGQYVYYAKEVERHWELWRVPAAGGEETPVLKNIWQGYWAVTLKGIYHLAPEGAVPMSVNFYDFATAADATVLPEVPQPVTTAPGLAASPDGRWVLLQQEVHRRSNIVLVKLGLE